MTLGTFLRTLLCACVALHTGQDLPAWIRAAWESTRDINRARALLAQHFNLQSLHGLQVGEGSRDELRDSVVVQKPVGGKTLKRFDHIWLYKRTKGDDIGCTCIILTYICAWGQINYVKSSEATGQKSKQSRATNQIWVTVTHWLPLPYVGRSLRQPSDRVGL